MKVEALEDVKSGNYILTQGDQVTVPDAEGAHWCEMGWARDLSGTVATGERSTTPRTLSVASVAHSATARI